MKRNRKIFVVGVSIVSVLLTIAILASCFIRLDETLYFNTDVELEVFVEEDMAYFSLNVRSITNIDDNRSITNVELFDSESTHYGSFDSFYLEPQVIGMYKYFDFRAEMYTDRDDIADSSKITDVAVYYDDGSVENINLRNVTLKKSSNKEDSAFDMKEMHSSNDLQATRYDVRNTVTLKSLSSTILDKYSEFIMVTVNGVDYKDINNMTLHQGDTLTIETNISDEMNREFPLSIINMVLRLEYEENSSLKTLDTSHGVTHFEYASFIDLYKQIRESKER